MLRQSKIDDAANRFIRDKIRQARLDALESQEDLAKALEKSRVTISDMERGRVEINVSDLGFIAAHYDKPISFFYPPRVVINQNELTQLDEELLFLFIQLPETQKHIAIEYIRQQVDITNREFDRQEINNSIKPE
jgi:transcriptional regulator with XRE-family HTH domain